MQADKSLAYTLLTLIVIVINQNISKRQPKEYPV